MKKLHSVRLSEAQRVECQDRVKKLEGSPQLVRRAQMLLWLDEEGQGCWTDRKVVEALRRRFAAEGFERALHRKLRAQPPRPKKLDGRQEAEIAALAMSTPPTGCGSWSLRLLAERVVELEIVDSISHETIRRTLKKRHADRSEDAAMGDSAEGERARRMARRLEIVYTPKHGSWLNVAECELSAMTRQCLNGRRIGNLKDLRLKVEAWAERTNGNAVSTGS